MAVTACAAGGTYRHVVHAFGRILGRRMGSLHQLARYSRFNFAADAFSAPLMAIPIGSLALRSGAWGTNPLLRLTAPLALFTMGGLEGCAMRTTLDA